MTSVPRGSIGSILHDDRAQALTEFVIVIPALLLMFFGCMQTMIIARAAQLSNYAAFASARTFATGYSKYALDRSPADAERKAIERARAAATMIMAPVSFGTTAEVPESFQDIRRQVRTNFIDNNQRMQGILEGVAVAAVFRIQNFRVNLPPGYQNDSRAVISVDFDYVQPLDLPGLAEVWNYFNQRPGQGSETNVFDDVWDQGVSVRAGDEPPYAELRRVLEEWNPLTIGVLSGPRADWAREYNLFMNNTPLDTQGHPATITIRAKASMGFEPFSAISRGGGNSDTGTGTSDNECVNEANRRQAAIEDQQEITDEECEEARQAEQDWNAARNALSSCESSADDPIADCAAERQEERRTRRIFDREREECENEGERLADMQEDFADWADANLGNCIESAAGPGGG